MSFLRKHAASEATGNTSQVVDADFLKTYPALGEYLTSTQYPDGSQRQTSSLTVFREDGYWKACLNERDQGLVMFVAENRFGSLLEALELLLQEESPPWRKATSKGRSGGRTKGGGT